MTTSRPSHSPGQGETAGTNLPARVRSGVLWSAASFLVVASAATAQVLLLTHMIEPSAFGLMAIVTLFHAVVGIYVDLGLSGAIIYRQDATREQLSTLYYLNLFSAAVGVLILALAAPVAATVFGKPELRALLLATAPAFLLGAIGAQPKVMLRRDLRFGRLAVIQIAGSVVSLAIALSLALLGQGVWALVIGLLAGTTSQSVLALALSPRVYLPAWHFRLGDVRSFLAFGFYQVGEATLYLVARRIDVIVLGMLLTAEELGLYDFSMQVVFALTTRLQPVLSNVAFPVFAKLHGDRARLQRGYLQLLGIVSSVVSPLMAGLAVIAPRAFGLLLDARWQGALPILQALCWLGFCRGIGGPIGSLMLAQGRADLGFKWNLVLLPFNVAAAAAGAALGGGFGVAVGLGIAQIVLWAPSWYVFNRPLLGPRGREYHRAIFTPAVGALAMAGLLVAAEPLWRALPGALALSAEIVFGALAYLMYLWLADRDGLVRIARMVGLQGRNGSVTG